LRSPSPQPTAHPPSRPPRTVNAWITNTSYTTLGNKIAWQWNATRLTNPEICTNVTGNLTLRSPRSGNITGAVVNVTGTVSGLNTCTPTCPATAAANVTFNCTFSCTGCGATVTMTARLSIDGVLVSAGSTGATVTNAASNTTSEGVVCVCHGVGFNRCFWHVYPLCPGRLALANQPCLAPVIPALRPRPHTLRARQPPSFAPPQPAGVTLTDFAWKSNAADLWTDRTSISTNQTAGTQTFQQTPYPPNYAAGQCASYLGTYWFLNTFSANVSGTNATLATSTVNVTNVPCPRPTATNTLSANSTRSYSWTLTAGTPTVVNATGNAVITWPVNVNASQTGSVNSTRVAGSCTVTGVASRNATISSIAADAVGGTCTVPTCGSSSLVGAASTTCTYTCDPTVTTVACKPTFATGDTISSLNSTITVTALGDSTGCLRLNAPLFTASATTAWTDRVYCALNPSTGGAGNATNVAFSISTTRGALTLADCPRFGLGNSTVTNNLSLLMANGTTFLSSAAAVIVPCPTVALSSSAGYSTTQSWAWCACQLPAHLARTGCPRGGARARLL
jgi:hypothetical protein